MVRYLPRAVFFFSGSALSVRIFENKYMGNSISPTIFPLVCFAFENNRIPEFKEP